MISNSPIPEPVLLFDDACGFCNSAVQTILRRERVHTLRFASLHGKFGLDFHARHPEMKSVDSMIWFRPENGNIGEILALRSDAALLTADYLGGPYRLAALGRIVPKGIRDAAYDFVARHRHKLHPAPKDCLIPSPEQRSRFLP